jgi:hypothetical protein
VFCKRVSIYDFKAIVGNDMRNFPGNYDTSRAFKCAETPIFYFGGSKKAAQEVPPRVADLFLQASNCRVMGLHDAAGAMFRKTLDVATKHIYKHDERLASRNPADALRVRIQGLGSLGILEHDIVDLADVVAVDGNDAAHDEDPFTAEEAEALEDLTEDLLDRLFVRPARIAAVKAKQIAAGVRKS